MEDVSQQFTLMWPETRVNRCILIKDNYYMWAYSRVLTGAAAYLSVITGIVFFFYHKFNLLRQVELSK